MNTYQLNTFKILSALISALLSAGFTFCLCDQFILILKFFLSTKRKCEFNRFLKTRREIREYTIQRPDRRIHAERGSDLSTQDLFCDNIFGKVHNVDLYTVYVLKSTPRCCFHWSKTYERDLSTQLNFFQARAELPTGFCEQKGILAS